MRGEGDLEGMARGVCRADLGVWWSRRLYVDMGFFFGGGMGD